VRKKTVRVTNEIAVISVIILVHVEYPWQPVRLKFGMYALLLR